MKYFFIYVFLVFSQEKAGSDFIILSEETNSKLELVSSDLPQWTTQYYTKVQFKNKIHSGRYYRGHLSINSHELFNKIEDIEIFVNGEEVTDDLIYNVVAENTSDKHEKSSYGIKLHTLKPDDVLELKYEAHYNSGYDLLKSISLETYAFQVKHKKLTLKINKNLLNNFKIKYQNTDLKPIEIDGDNFKSFTWELNDLPFYTVESATSGFANNSARIRYGYSHYK